MHVHEIATLGLWVAPNVMQLIYLTGLKPKGLATMGRWPGIVTGEYTKSFWAECFHVAVPSELVYTLVPWVSCIRCLW